MVWSKEVYERSVSSRCWWCTAYDGGAWEPVSGDTAMEEAVNLELGAAPIPEWAREIVENLLNFLPPCGHYRFPLAHLDVVKAIGAESLPSMLHGCYTVDPERKRQMQDYCLCLDGWLAGASPDSVASELDDLGHLKIDWVSTCRDLWGILGEHSDNAGDKGSKEFLVERLLVHLRWWIKFTVWDEDLASEFGRDQYLGEYSPTGGTPGRNCFIDRPVPEFGQKSIARLKELETRLRETTPLWEELRPWILEEWWLCAPKAFRFLERILWQIGKGRRLQEGDRVPSFLSAEDTCPSREEAARWWEGFCEGLLAWKKQEPPRGDIGTQIAGYLGPQSPVKRWLIALYLRKIELYEEWRFGKLVKPESQEGIDWGTGPLRDA